MKGGECLMLAILLALGLFFAVAEAARGLVWIRWAFQ